MHSSLQSVCQLRNLDYIVACVLVMSSVIVSVGAGLFVRFVICVYC